MSDENKNPHIGSSFEDWLKEEGIFEECDQEATRRIKIWEAEQKAAGKWRDLPIPELTAERLEYVLSGPPETQLQRVYKLAEDLGASEQALKEVNQKQIEPGASEPQKVSRVKKPGKTTKHPSKTSLI